MSPHNVCQYQYFSVEKLPYLELYLINLQNVDTWADLICYFFLPFWKKKWRHGVWLSISL